MFCTKGLRFLRICRVLSSLFQQLAGNRRARRIRVRPPLALPTLVKSIICKFAVPGLALGAPPRTGPGRDYQIEFAPRQPLQPHQLEVGVRASCCEGLIVLRSWPNWQTRMLEVHVPVRVGRFQSCRPHQPNQRSKTLVRKDLRHQAPRARTG